MTGFVVVVVVVVVNIMLFSANFYTAANILSLQLNRMCVTQRLYPDSIQVHHVP